MHTYIKNDDREQISRSPKDVFRLFFFVEKFFNPRKKYGRIRTSDFVEFRADRRDLPFAEDFVFKRRESDYIVLPRRSDATEKFGYVVVFGRLRTEHRAGKRAAVLVAVCGKFDVPLSVEHKRGRKGKRGEIMRVFRIAVLPRARFRADNVLAVFARIGVFIPYEAARALGIEVLWSVDVLVLNRRIYNAEAA